jgi:hypothetical protein
MKTGAFTKPINSRYCNKPTQFVRCVDCGIELRWTSWGVALVNGYEVHSCPWCSPNSKPWTNGRGI